MNEADTCRLYVESKLRDAGWETPQAELDALLPAVLDRAFRREAVGLPQSHLLRYNPCECEQASQWAYKGAATC